MVNKIFKRSRRDFMKGIALTMAALSTGKLKAEAGYPAAIQRNIREKEWRNRQEGIEYRRLGDVMVSQLRSLLVERFFIAYSKASFRIIYSYLSASIGSTFAASMAGKVPEIIPTVMENITEPMITNASKTNVSPNP